MSTLTITGIQADLYWENPEANRNKLEGMIKNISDKTEIIILPEMFSTGFSMRPEPLAETMEGKTIQWMRRVAGEKKIILTGSLIIAGDCQTGTARPPYYNRLIWMLPDGQYGYYDKRHLFAYAGEDEHFTPGSKRLIASVKGWKINLLVCYDLRFPVWARQQSNEEGPEFDLLIYVANWPERRIHAWKTLLQARAIENQCYVAGINRVGKDGHDIYHSGSSMVIDPMGEILYHEENKEDIFTITLHKEKLIETRTKLPFWKDGDSFLIQSS